MFEKYGFYDQTCKYPKFKESLVFGKEDDSEIYVIQRSGYIRHPEKMGNKWKMEGSSNFRFPAYLEDWKKFGITLFSLFLKNKSGEIKHKEYSDLKFKLFIMNKQIKNYLVRNIFEKGIHGDNFRNEINNILLERSIEWN